MLLLKWVEMCFLPTWITFSVSSLRLFFAAEILQQFFFEWCLLLFTSQRVDCMCLQMCVGQRCVLVSSLPVLTCPDCHGHGVCYTTRALFTVAAAHCVFSVQWSIRPCCMAVQLHIDFVSESESRLQHSLCDDVHWLLTLCHLRWCEMRHSEWVRELVLFDYAPSRHSAGHSTGGLTANHLVRLPSFGTAVTDVPWCSGVDTWNMCSSHNLLMFSTKLML